MINDPALKEAAIRDWANPNYTLTKIDKMMIEKMLDGDDDSCSNK